MKMMMKLKLLLPLVLVWSSLALAEKAPRQRAITAVVIPMDGNSQAQQLRLEKSINESLREFRTYKLRTSDDIFPVLSDSDAATALQRAETGFEESREAFADKAFDEAERKLRATIKEFSKAVAAMKTCGKLCDAVTMYAATLHARGDNEEAKLVLLDLLSLGGTSDLDKKRYSPEFLALRAQVASSRNAHMRGTLLVKAKPSGARVFINGNFQGYTPLTLNALAVGKTMVRVEHPGYHVTGMMVDVTPDDQSVTAELSPASSYASYDGQLDKVVAESQKDRGGPTLFGLGKVLDVDLGVLAVVKEREQGDQTEVVFGLYDFKHGRRLSAKRITFTGDEYGQMNGEVVRLVNSLMNNAESTEAVSTSSDPLDRKGGTEDWNAEDRGGKTTSRDKKRSGDPLDERNGTDEW